MLSEKSETKRSDLVLRVINFSVLNLSRGWKGSFQEKLISDVYQRFTKVHLLVKTNLVSVSNIMKQCGWI